MLRIDKDQTSFGAKTALANVARLFQAPMSYVDDPPHEQRRRSLCQRLRGTVVDLQSPSFTPDPTLATAADVTLRSTSMNAGQRRAIERVVSHTHRLHWLAHVPPVRDG